MPTHLLYKCTCTCTYTYVQMYMYLYMYVQHVYNMFVGHRVYVYNVHVGTCTCTTCLQHVCRTLCAHVQCTKYMYVHISGVRLFPHPGSYQSSPHYCPGHHHVHPSSPLPSPLVPSFCLCHQPPAPSRDGDE